jgi:hypothetical protein
MPKLSEDLKAGNFYHHRAAEEYVIRSRSNINNETYYKERINRWYSDRSILITGTVKGMYLSLYFC